MAKRKNLATARQTKNDEFYTQLTDIEKELCHYAQHFKGKVVYCNCNDSETSAFWRFFAQNFEALGLRKLIATHYEPDAKRSGYMLEMESDESGQVRENQGPVITPLQGNGDFRSQECIELLQQSDIVATNPPFSLFREYMAQLMEYGKKFLILGNINAITYKEFFPLLKDNKVWAGYKFNGKAMLFGVPKDYPLMGTAIRRDESGNPLVGVGGTCWYTNLDIPKRHQPLDLRGNYYYRNEAKYPRYDNYDAIDVSRVADIPSDYDGVMGVPITFMGKYCPEQFEIVAFRKGEDGKDLAFTRDGERVQPYFRILVRPRLHG